MLIFPAIDLYEGKAVRLYKGDYNQMTVYHTDPVAVAMDFRAAGATHVHLVDLEGARNGDTPNLATVCRIKEECGLFCEIGGGVRSMAVVDLYIAAGLDRVILGTAAVSDPDFLSAAIAKYGDKIAVGVDIKGVKTLICTDISRDGAMKGANHALYRELSERFGMQIVASGGVSSMEDVEGLTAMGLYGAIVGKAYYTGAISLKEAIEVAKA